jgi:hypothetical protein
MSDIRDDVADAFDYAAGLGTRHAMLRDEAADILFELGSAEVDAIPNMVRTAAAIGLVNTMCYAWRKQTGSLPPLFETMLRDIADGRVSDGG